MRVRFGPWSGLHEPFPPDVSPEAVLDALADDLLGGHGADEALRRLLSRGFEARSGQHVAGLDDLRRRVEEARRRELSRMGLEAPLREVEQRLAEIVEMERTALELEGDERNAERAERLDALPTDVAARLAALEDHDWCDERARRDFEALRDELRRDVAQATFGRLASALGAMGPEDAARLAGMLGELNALVQRRERGEDVAADWEVFRGRHADLLDGLGPDGVPESLDELLAELARRMAALSRLMAGLDPGQREALARLADQLLGDLDLSFQAQQLASTLESMFPALGWDAAPPGVGPAAAESGSLSQTVDWVEHLQSFDDLAEALGQRYAGARLEDVDDDAVRRLLGEDAARDLRALKEVERVLEQAGATSRQHGRLELTPRGIRRLGERSLARIYDRAVRAGPGSHRASNAGGEGELTGTTRALRFGDPFRLDVPRTIGNAVKRAGPVRESGRRAVRLTVDDFELAEAERRVRAATVLLLDMSFSMPLRGNWVPAKRVALALQSLVDGRFPEDRFYVVGFSDYARRLQPRDLLETGWERVYGTNMQHAFLLARRLLAAHPDAEQQVLMVTDGEPTAHLDGDVPHFAWPPEPRTLQLTLAEAVRLSRTGATLNVFLLDHDPGAAAFVERMVGAYGGRIFYPDLDDLGSLVVRDFLGRRR